MVDRVDPVSGFRFSIEVGKTVKGWFTECSGLTVTRKTEDRKEGGVNNYVHKLPGRIEYGQISLKHGLAGNELWDWFQAGLYDGKVDRRNVTITLYNTDRKKIRKWNLKDAYPVKWTGPTLNSAGNDAVIETLELVHHGLEMVDWVSAAA